MGSGNKQKRKQKQGQTAKAGEPAGAARPSGFAGLRPPPRPLGERSGKGGFVDPNENAGVTFALEPDADRLFRESVESMDEAMVRRKAAVDDWDHSPGYDGIKNRSPIRDDGSGESASSYALPTEIDLHRMTLDQALAKVDDTIMLILDQVRDQRGQLRAQATLKIITGKGLHSGASGGVLAREIHRHVAQRYALMIVRIDESPAEVKVGGVPIRGHFQVTFGKR